MPAFDPDRYVSVQSPLELTLSRAFGATQAALPFSSEPPTTTLVIGNPKEIRVVTVLK